MNVAGSGWIVTASGEAATPLGVGAVPWKATWTAAEGSVAGFRPAASRIPNSNLFRPTMVSEEMSCGVNGRDPAPTGLVDGPAEPVAPGEPADPTVQAVTSNATRPASATQGAALRSGRDDRWGFTRASYRW